MHYKDSKIAFDAPEEWEDRTIVAFSEPKKAGRTVNPSFAISREKPNPGESLDAYANRQLVEAAKRLDEFKFYERTATTISGIPAVELSFSWNAQALGGIFRQRQIMISHKDKMISIVITALEADYPAVEAKFNAFLATVELT